MGKIWESIKSDIKQRIDDGKKLKQEIAEMDDKELKQKAVREGGAYADAWVKRKTAEKELSDRIRGKK